jgi:flavin reductase (DIM6/NTAB) family NADH-FMN oxidoreductase RutF
MTDGEPRKSLGAALGRIPSGLFILTIRRGPAETGMLVSWVQQCGFEPPSIILAVQREREILTWLSDGAPFTLNVLDDTQTDMIAHFGKGFRTDEQAFTGLEVERSADGALILCESLAYLQCEVAGRWPVADHDLFLGRVVAGRILNEGHPMIHVRRNGFHY